MNKIHSFANGQKRTWLVASAILCILMLAFMVCAGESYANQTQSKNRTSLPENASGVQKNAKKTASVYTRNNQIILDLPIDENIDVSPDYSHPMFRLNFTPAVAELNIPEAKDIDLIKNIEMSRSSTDNNISSVDILLNKKAQFLLSRTKPENLQLKFVPGLTQKDSQEETKEKARVEKKQEPAENKLKDVRFTQDDEGTLFIKLITLRKTEYQPRPDNKKSMTLLLPDVRIPSNYAKIYDLKKFKSTVEKATLQDTAKGGKLELSFSKRSPVSVTSKQNKLVVSVQSLTKQTAQEKEEKQKKEKKVAETEQKASRNKTQAVADEQEGKKLLYPEMEGEYSGKEISLDLQNANIEHVLRLIAQVAGYNLIIGDNVSGEISLKLDNIPWDQALDLVLIQKNLGMVQKGNILRVVTLEQLQEEQKRIEETQQAAQERAPLRTEYIQINYTNAGNLQSNVQKFTSERGQVGVDQRTNQLIVSDTRENINKIKEVIQKLDRPERQVLIEARLVYATDQFQRGLGLQWGGGYEYRSSYGGDDYNQGVYGASGDAISVSASPENSGFAVNLPNEGETTFGMGAFISKLTGSDLFTLDARLEIGETKNQVKTISSPRVVTLNNQEAQMVQGTMLATQAESESGGTTTEYTEATLELSVTPQITPNNKLILDLDITDDSPAAGGGSDIETREASTKVIVNNNETIVLGGVREVTQTRQKSKVPWLAEIPLLGWLFKSDLQSEEERELLIFIRPKILSVS